MNHNPPLSDSKEEQLRMLSIFHYVLGATTACVSLIPLLYLAMGLLIIITPTEFSNNSHSGAILAGWLLIIFSTVSTILGLVFSVAQVITGRFLIQKKHYTFCVAMAVIQIPIIPFGTVLGISTCSVLNDAPTRQSFGKNEAK